MHVFSTAELPEHGIYKFEFGYKLGMFEYSLILKIFLDFR